MNVEIVSTPTIAKEKVSPGNSIVMNGIKWETYKALMADVGDGRAWRIAYDEGVLEIRMPLTEHEEPKILIGSFIESQPKFASLSTARRKI